MSLSLKYYFKKTLNNRRRLFTILAGMILTLSLFAGISFYVSRVSTSILIDFNKSQDVDIRIDSGLVDPINASVAIQQYIHQEKLSTVKNIAPFYSWYLTAINWEWDPVYPDEIPSSYPLALGVPVISVTDAFYDTCSTLIKMKQGTWNFSVITDASKTIYNVVVTESFLKRNSLSLMDNITGSEFSTWIWKSDISVSDKAINEKKYCRIAGVIDSSSELFEDPYFIPLIDYWGFICSPSLHPPFFRNIVFQKIFVDTSEIIDRVFTFNLFLSFKKSALIPDQPLRSITQLDNDMDFLLTILGTSNNRSTYSLYYQSIDGIYYHTIDYDVLRGILVEYEYWYSAALPKFILFSSPVFFLGIYVLNFSVQHTMKDRRKEISNLKSRGFANQQIWFMMLFENVIIAIIGAIVGAFCGQILSGVLEENFNIDERLAALQTITFNEIFELFIIGLSLIMIISIIPIIQVINIEIDILKREETTSDDNTEEVGLFYHNSKILLIALFFVIGIPNSKLLMTMDNSFSILLGLFVFCLFLVAGIAFMSQIARLTSSLIDRVTKSTIPQFYLLSREMQRLSKRHSAAFIVLSLTMAFGVISSSIISSAGTYYLQDSEFEIGSDVNVAIVSSLQQQGSIYRNTFNNLRNKTLYPEITACSPIYLETGYILANDEAFPNTQTYTFKAFHTQMTVLFINSSMFADAAFYKDYFVKSSRATNASYVTLSNLMTLMNDNYNNGICSAIVDSSTAQIQNIDTGGEFKFTVGSKSGYYILKGDTQVVAIADYFAPGLNAKQEPFVVVDYRIITNAVFNTKTPLSSVLVKLSSEYKTQMDWGNRFLTRLNLDKAQYLHGVVPIDSQCVQIKLSNDNLFGRDFNTLMNLASLNFYYALIVSAIGFLLVLEIKTVEKKKEIGILKAVGFGHRETFNLILIEGIISIVTASVTGLIIGMLCAEIIMLLFLPNLLLPKFLVIWLDQILLQFILGILSALFGVIIPAYQTKRFTISELIQHE